MSSCLHSWTTATLPPHPIEWEHLWAYSRIRIHGGKTQVWNAVDDRPEFCDVLEQIVQRSDPHARVWRGSALPLDKQGVKVLGTPLGHPLFVEAYLCKKTAAQEVLLERILAVPDLQSSWSLLLHCASARANYLLRVVKPEATRAYSQRHNEGLWKCLCKILHVDPGHCAEAKVAASMPLNLGGMGLRDALRVATPAYWASWADCMPIIFKRHAHVANLFMHELDVAPGGALGAAAEARQAVTGVLGFDPPTWEALAAGARPPIMEPEEMEPGGRRGWQHAAASKVEHQHREELFVHMRPSHRAQVRSQAGPGAGMALSSAPVNFLTRIPPHLFRVVLLRRLRLPFASIVAHMPVWPPNRQVWPPPSIVRTSRGVGAEAGSHWKARQPEFEGKLEVESQPTSWSVIWTLLNQGPQTDAGLRWLWMASPCLGDAS